MVPQEPVLFRLPGGFVRVQVFADASLQAVVQQSGPGDLQGHRGAGRQAAEDLVAAGADVADEEAGRPGP